MFFMLSNALIFDPDTQKISLAGHPDSAVTLSAPAVRLLLEFIRNRGEELSRETLITRVWQDFGYTPSGNNLNKAVSEIRKAFQSLGIHVSPIVTVPGKGFYFDADVTGQKRLSKADAIEPVPPPQKTKPSKRRLSLSTQRPYCIAALVVSTLIGGGYLFSEYAMKSPKAIKLPNERFEKCTVWRINAPERPIALSNLLSCSVKTTWIASVTSMTSIISAPVSLSLMRMRFLLAPVRKTKRIYVKQFVIRVGLKNEDQNAVNRRWLSDSGITGNLPFSHQC